MTTAEAVVTKEKIANIQQGKRYSIEGDFQKFSGKTAKQDPYLRVEIKDNSGKASQPIWSNLPLYSTIEGLENGIRVEAEVTCTKIGQYINIEIHTIKEIERVVEVVVEKEAIQSELRNEIRSFVDEDLKTLVTNVFRREDVNEAFFTAPASQKSGYSFEGALCAHVVRSIRLAKAIAEVFDNWSYNLDGTKTKLNLDLLKTACILHDVGKVKAFQVNGFIIEKTDEGKLFEDSYLSMKIVLEELEKVNLPEYQRMMLEHVLGASKGQQRFGALHIPRSREAMAFHFIDALDVQMANFEHLDREADVADLFVTLFEKQLFLGVYEE